MKSKKYEDYTNEELRNMSYDDRERLKLNYYIRKGTKYTVIGICIIFLIITLFSSFKAIPTGYVGVKTRFGKVQDDVIQEGLNTKVPYIEKIVKIDCRTQKIELESATATKDLQEVTFKIAVNYNITKQTANELYRTTGISYQDIIVNPAILESIKAVTAQYKADELITKRSDVSNKMQETLKNKIENKGFNVIDFNIIDLDFSAEYNQAIEKKQVAEQQAKQAEYELQKAKVENEKKIENAKAEAEVMRQQNKEITDKTLELKRLETQQKLIEKWNGTLPTTTSDDVLSIFNVNK